MQDVELYFVRMLSQNIFCEDVTLSVITKFIIETILLQDTKYSFGSSGFLASSLVPQILHGAREPCLIVLVSAREPCLIE